jgi:hypothetical protein
VGQFWMEITAITGSDFDGIQQGVFERVCPNTWGIQ